MERWMTVRKGYDASVYLAFARTFSNNIFAYNTRLRDEPELEIRVDLNPNLRGRSKDTNTYLDATELADGDIEQLTLYQTEDEMLIKALDRTLSRLGGSPDTWRLTLELKGDHSFLVKPEVRTSGALVSLFLNVVR